MTDDIVTRLKKYLDGRPGVGGRTFDPLHPEMLIAECADEIECLRGEVRRWVRFSNDDANKIERLRAALTRKDAEPDKLSQEAADEIERLRTALKLAQSLDDPVLIEIERLRAELALAHATLGDQTWGRER
jgi:hypothetical protein